jgi:Uma2 family endonuclease
MSHQAILLEKEWTQEEWLSLPEGPPYYELEGGKLVPIPSPRREHQQVTGLLFARLHDYCRQSGAGTVVMEVDVALPNGRGYIPDIAFIAREREKHLLAPDGKVHGAPDLVVEVLSPSTRLRDLFTKLEGYQQAGVRFYWVIDPESLLIAEYELTEEGYVLRSHVEEDTPFRPRLFPNLEIRLSELMSIQA